MMKKSLSEDQRKKLRGERKININQRMQIVREIQEGNITVEQAAKDYNRHRTTIFKWIKIANNPNVKKILNEESNKRIGHLKYLPDGITNKTNVQPASPDSLVIVKESLDFNEPASPEKLEMVERF
jgi:transposase-like protein